MRGMKKSVISALMFLALALPFNAWGAVIFGPPATLEHRSKSVSAPAAAIDDDGNIYIAWLEEQKDVNAIYIAVSSDSGKTFSPEVKVNGLDDEPSSIHDAPAMALGRKGEVYLAWTSSRGEGFASDLRFARSADSGKTFAPSVRVNDNRNPATAGFASIAAGDGGSVYVVWLDGREKAAKGAATYIAVSGDGEKFSANIPVDYNSCPCCRTAVAVAPDNSVYAVWRKVFPNDIREVVISRSAGGEKNFSAPAVVGHDNWEISGCPHRGSSVMPGKDGGVFVSWYAEVDGEPGIFLGVSKDSGKSFEKERIEHRKGTFPDNVAFNLRGDELLLVWQETTPVVSNVIFEARKGGERTRLRLNEDSRKAVNPVISVNRKGGVLVAWQKMDMRVMKTVFVIGK